MDTIINPLQDNIQTDHRTRKIYEM